MGTAGDQLLCMKIHTQKAFARGFKRSTRDSNAVAPVFEITKEMRAAAPAAVDWSTQGVLTPVKNQGQCGSCWAYSATEGIESYLAMNSGVLEELSEQQIVSCDKTDGGCNGGDLPTAWDYVKSAGGIVKESPTLTPAVPVAAPAHARVPNSQTRLHLFQVIPGQFPNAQVVPAATRMRME